MMREFATEKKIDHESLSELSEGNGYKGRRWSELAELKVTAAECPQGNSLQR
jgi:hypothetical protein